jgi:hypothetical protein
MVIHGVHPTLPVMTDPMVDAARAILDESFDDMRAAIDGASPDALNRRPAGDETNSIAVLAVHSMNSTRWWLSLALTSSTPARDRPSEFLATADNADELLDFYDGMAAECRSLLDTDAPLDAGALRTDNGGEVVTVGWALLHAVEHFREHVGHIQLTRQVVDAAGA